MSWRRWFSLNLIFPAQEIINYGEISCRIQKLTTQVAGNFMMNDGQKSDPGLFDQFLVALQALPAANVEAFRQAGAAINDADTNTDTDPEIALHIMGQTITLLTQTRKTLYPRDARELLWQLDKVGAARRLQGGAQTTVLILLAESISPGAKAALHEAKVGYFERGGSLYIPAPSALVYIEKGPAKPAEKANRQLFAGRGAQVLHVLLAQPLQWFGTIQLAQQALVSPATASKMLAALTQYDWIAVRGQGPSKERRLAEPGALLDAWAKQIAVAAPPKVGRFFVPGIGIDMLIERIAQVCAEINTHYALTHEMAAQRYSPFLTQIFQVRCRILGSVAALEALGARPVSDGANLVLLDSVSEGDFLFCQQDQGICLASPLQTYLDLLRGEGRAKEMAEHLRHDKIGF